VEPGVLSSLLVCSQDGSTPITVAATEEIRLALVEASEEVRS
jgi:hypothetical protein